MKLIRMLGYLAATACASLAAAAPLTAEQLFATISPSVFSVRAIDARGTLLGTGSGVVVAPQRVITNCHVLAKSTGVLVKHGGVFYSAHLEHADAERDLCQLKVPDLNAPAVRIIGQIGDIRVGQRAYAIGAPSGLELTISEGLVSGLRIDKEGDDPHVQTSAPISPGSSGGGLFDDEGRLIGITTLIVAKRLAQNLNFAVPATWISEVPARATTQLASFRDKGKVGQTPSTRESRSDSPPTAPAAFGEDDIRGLVGRRTEVVATTGAIQLDLAANGWFSIEIVGRTGFDFRGLWRIEDQHLCLDQRAGFTSIANFTDCYTIEHNEQDEVLVMRVKKKPKRRG